MKENNEQYKYTKDGCIKALNKAQQRVDGQLSKREYEQMNILPSASFILDEFDSWNNAKQLAGLDTSPGKNTYSKQDCIESLKQVAEEIGKSPTIREYDEIADNPSRKVIKNIFGTWNNALRAANLEPNREGIATSETEYTKQDCIQALNKIANELGRSPTSYDYRIMDIKPSYDVLISYFGSFNDAKREANLECYNTNKKENKYTTKDYGNNWGDIRKQIIKQADLQCEQCGMSREKHYETFSQDLHVHHIKRIRNFDSTEVANHPSNLVAVCNQCHMYLECLSVEEQCKVLEISIPSII